MPDEIDWEKMYEQEAKMRDTKSCDLRGSTSIDEPGAVSAQPKDTDHATS